MLKVAGEGELKHGRLGDQSFAYRIHTWLKNRNASHSRTLLSFLTIPRRNRCAGANTQGGLLIPINDERENPTMARPNVYTMSFARIYPLYIQKAEKKGRTKAEVDEIILWLTGHTAKSLQKAIDAEIDLETFFAKAPRFQPNASLITGVVCGVRVEEIEDETMRKIRYLDKLIDELAKGKSMEKILRK
jgi:hypothetical protein